MPQELLQQNDMIVWKKKQKLEQVLITFILRNKSIINILTNDERKFNSLKQHVLTQIDLTPGVNFINVLCTAFTHPDPECAKKTVKSAVSFGAFGTYKRKNCA